MAGQIEASQPSSTVGGVYVCVSVCPCVCVCVREMPGIGAQLLWREGCAVCTLPLQKS